MLFPFRPAIFRRPSVTSENGAFCGDLDTIIPIVTAESTIFNSPVRMRLMMIGLSAKVLIKEYVSSYGPNVHVIWHKNEIGHTYNKCEEATISSGNVPNSSEENIHFSLCIFAILRVLCGSMYFLKLCYMHVLGEKFLRFDWVLGP